MARISGIELIVNERERQIAKEGWTPEHDAKHTLFELSRAATAYCEVAKLMGRVPLFWDWDGQDKIMVPNSWPWSREWWKPAQIERGEKIKPEQSIRMLVKAGALIAAEIDRIQAIEE